MSWFHEILSKAKSSQLKIHSHRKNISSNHLFIYFFGENVVFTKVLPKNVWEWIQCPTLPQHSVEIAAI